MQLRKKHFINLLRRENIMEQIMKDRIRHVLFGMLIISFVVLSYGMMNVSSVIAKEKESQIPNASAVEDAQKIPDVDPKADKILKAAGDLLKSREKFTFDAKITFDNVLPTGQKIQYGADMHAAIRRPNKINIRFEGDLTNKQFWYDGKTITLTDALENVFARVEAPSEIDATLDFIEERFNLSLPLADMLYSDPYKKFSGYTVFGDYIGTAEVEGIKCHHLAFVQDSIDWQVWIQDGKKIPRKIVITYKTRPGSPQYTAVFTRWDFGEKLPDELFEAGIPDDTDKIEFLLVSDNK